MAADYRAEALDVELVSIEAKGPHCRLAGHLDEGVLGLSECGQLDTGQLDALAVPQMAA